MRALKAGELTMSVRFLSKSGWSDARIAKWLGTTSQIVREVLGRA